MNKFAIINYSDQDVRCLVELDLSFFAEKIYQALTTFSVLSVDQIIVTKSGCSSKMCGLFAEIRHIERDAPLPLRFVQYFIHDID